ncbi:MAG TPA: response regulator, partial [Candidatus Sulfotelmatobacter sp.]|nr:response regulator [Candidatus Sulfotelmatobacter sp.]
MPERATVFIVDDDDAVRDSLQFLLQSADHATMGFASAGAFLDFYRQEYGGCLIADVRMPDMTGLELQELLDARRIRIPVVIVTGHGDIAMAVGAMRAGAVDFIEKPFSDATILNAVERALARSDATTNDAAGRSEAADAQAKMRTLTPRELDVLRELLRGRPTEAIAAALDISARTVETHRARLKDKMGAESTADLVRLAVAGGLDPLKLDLHPAADGDPNALLQGFVDATRTILDAEQAAVAIFETDSTQVRWFFVSGLAPNHPARREMPPADSRLTSAAETRLPYRPAGPTSDPWRIGLPRSFPVISGLLGIPLATRTRVFGWLAVANKRGRLEFDAEDERLAVTLAGQVTRTLELDLLNIELRARVEQQRAIAHLAGMALGAEDLQALFDWATQVVARTLDVEFASILELDQAKGAMLVRAGVGWPDGIVGRRIAPDGESLLGRAMRTKEPIAFMNLTGGDGQLHAASYMLDSGVDSGLTVAIPGMTHTFGTLGAHTRATRRFSADEVDFVCTAASVLGQAIIGKQTAASLHKAQKMEAIGQLTGGLAHDFNNLLTVIIGNLEMLERRVADAPQRELVREAQEASELGAKLSSRLLAFGRRQALSPKPIQLSALVEGMADLLRRTLGETVRIETALESGLPLTMADPGQVENALLNLAINARDAMPKGGRLTIETGMTFLDAEDAVYSGILPGRYITLAVTDTGTGMAPEVVERAFEPFFTTKQVGAGSGLGLSMVYGFVRQSGGSVRLESEVGRGTTVRIVLPVVDEESGASGAPHGEPFKSHRGKETILVVEDDARVRRVSVRRLQELGYTVIEVESAPAALEVLDLKAPVDLLFTDV